MVRGVELHYIERGNGVPLVLLHGGQGDYRAWGPHMEALAPHFRVISYSRRYHYPNHNPIAADHNALVDAEDLAALITELRLGPVHLVGTSYGAFTALALAMAHPTMVRSLVLAEAPILGWATHDSVASGLYRDFLAATHVPAARAFAAGDDEGAIRAFLDAFDGPGTFAALPPERRVSIMQNADYFKAITRATDPYPDVAKDAVARVRVPALVVRGAQTHALDIYVADELARVLPHAQTVVIPNAGHGSPRQQPKAFLEAVFAFLHIDGATK
ncbi:MAG: alpha/beta hydrolase [Gemmatimonadaceae bacterium]|nr:alpha/beta hydrolase [Gemmatimonadaceae bacterium]